jgi:hypothetical protein
VLAALAIGSIAAGSAAIAIALLIAGSFATVFVMLRFSRRRSA